MGRLFALAGRNLLRHRSRTLFTFISISIGLALYLILDSMMGGLDQLGIKNLIDLEMGHYRIHAPGYFLDRQYFPLDKSISDPQDVMDRLDGTPGINGVSPRVQFRGNLNNGSEEIPIVGIGVDVAKDPSVFTIFQYISSGGLFSSGEYKALIGKRLAELMELDVGDYAIIITRTQTNTFQAIDVEIGGVLDSPHPQVNIGFVYLPLDIVQGSLAIGQSVTEINLRLSEQDAASRIGTAIRERLGDIPFEGVSWRVLAGDFLALSQSKRAGQGVIMFIVLIIAAVGIINTLLLSTLERTKEIGTMKAMGMLEKEITTLFLIESGGIGLLGSLGGCILAALVNVYLVEVGINFGALLGPDFDIGWPVDLFHGVWNWGSYTFAFVFGVAVCLIVGFFPSRRASRLDAVEALGHV